MKKINFTTVLLLALPGALLDVMNNIYNAYVPVYLQAGNPNFSGSTLTLGFGVGVGLVGLWMTLDNVFGFIIQPIVGARSDRTKSRWGRRLPFVWATLPLALVGFALIPIAPHLIPPEMSGQIVVGLFALFTLACIVYNLGYIPQRSILQTLRQESLAPEDRPKIESWNSIFTTLGLILAYTFGAALYRFYAPALFWTLAVIYAAATLALLFLFREPPQLVESADAQQHSVFLQLRAIFSDPDRRVRANIVFFLLSVFLIIGAISATGNFITSWIVNVLNFDESRATQLLSIYTLTSAIAALPAGYWAAKKWGHRRVYAAGTFIAFLAFALMAFFPALHLLALAVFGVGLSAAIITQLPLATELQKRQDNLGAMVGVFNFAYMLAYVLGTNVIGWIIQMTSYHILFYVTASVMLLGFLFILAIRDADAR